MQIGADIRGQREVGGGDRVLPRHTKFCDFILTDGSPAPKLSTVLQDGND